MTLEINKTVSASPAKDVQKWRDFAVWLKETRRKQGLTQTEAAIKAGWAGINGKVSWARYEQGRPAHLETVLRLGKALEVDEEEILRRTGYSKPIEKEHKITLTYTGPDRSGIAAAITQVASDWEINVIRVCIEGSEGATIGFIQLTGVVATQDVDSICLDIEIKARRALHAILDKQEAFDLVGRHWNFYVKPVRKRADSKQVFNFDIATRNQPGELHKLVTFLMDESFEIIAVNSLSTPPAVNVTRNIGQCSRMLSPKWKKGDMNAYIEDVSRRVADILSISVDYVSFRPVPTELPDALKYSQDIDQTYQYLWSSPKPRSRSGTKNPHLGL